jgi:uncharacterized protein (DUF3084 family)
MTSAYILVAAVLVLGGILAALGDRLGSKVGKARLTIFNLRPRQTAVLITVMTGILIAASTLGLLFGLSRSLRDGVFKLDDILKQGRLDVDRLNAEKAQILQELKAVKQQQQEVKSRLGDVNNKFQTAQQQLNNVTQQTTQLRSELKSLNQEKDNLVKQRQELQKQSKNLEAQVNQRDAELVKQNSTIREQDNILQQLKQQQRDLQKKINRQDQVISGLDNAIATKDQALQEKENQRKNLESELAFLQREVTILEQYYQYYQVLRQGDLALLKGQVLAFGGVRIENPSVAQQAVDQLLRQANRQALEALAHSNQNNNNEQIVSITQTEVQDVINKLKDGRDYVVRIICGGNYLKGEQEVRVFFDVALNELIFQQDQEIASVAMENNNLTQTTLQQQLDLLLATSQFRARRAGILGEIQVEQGSITTLSNFVENLQKSAIRPDQIQAIAINTTYTIGPLKLRLIALSQGEILFTTSSFELQNNN